MWVKKDVSKDYRVFYFAASTEEEREEWITTIELLKANAVHKTFQDTYCKISFPVIQESNKSKAFNKIPLPLALKQTVSIATYEDRKTARRPTSFGKPSMLKASTSTSFTPLERNEYDYKEKAKTLFNYSLVHFISYLTQHSLGKMNDKPFCLLPDLAKSTDILSLIERKARESDARVENIIGLQSVKHEESKQKVFSENTPRNSASIANSSENDLQRPDTDAVNKSDIDKSNNQKEKSIFHKNPLLGIDIDKIEEDKRRINIVKEVQETDSNDEEPKKLVSYRDPEKEKDINEAEVMNGVKKSIPNDITEIKGKKKVFIPIYQRLQSSQIIKSKKSEVSIDKMQSSVIIATAPLFQNSTFAVNPSSSIDNNIAKSNASPSQQIPNNYFMTQGIVHNAPQFGMMRSNDMTTKKTKTQKQTFKEESLNSYTKLMNALNQSLLDDDGEATKPLFNAELSDISPTTDNKQTDKTSKNVKKKKQEIETTVDSGK